ncbi:MAG: hypothetical protein OXT67_07585 [Zetaproteobacteria bacterium]|nr:hypothetical protein [Zetaproteobacteria bacterium]
MNQSTMLLMFLIGSLILTLALMILFHENANATKGYQLRTLERQRSKLLLEEEVLKMQVAESQALQRLEADNQVNAMIPMGRAVYTEHDSTVAQKIQM